MRRISIPTHRPCILCFCVVCIVSLLSGCSEENSATNQTNPNSSADALVSDTSDTNNTSTLCGNAFPDPNEQCDDGSANSDTLADACRTNCRNASCGDGVIDLRLNETCDDGNSIDDDACNNLCRLASCGDGALQPGEACDNGSDNSNTLPDACRLNCTEARSGLVCS